jgi:hypothetical protein
MKYGLSNVGIIIRSNYDGFCCRSTHPTKLKFNNNEGKIMNLTLNLSSIELDNEELQALTRQLCDSIADETEIKAEIPSGTVMQGTKGDPITLGVIVLAFLVDGSAVALFEMLKAYFSRVPSLTIKATKADGTSLEITAQNIKLEQLQSLLMQLNNPPH